MISSHATNVTWRGCTPRCPGCGAIELSFQESDGNTVRLRLSAPDAGQLCGVLLGMLHAAEDPSVRCRQCSSQSLTSPGNSQGAGSPERRGC